MELQCYKTENFKLQLQINRLKYERDNDRHASIGRLGEEKESYFPGLAQEANKDLAVKKVFYENLKI